MVGTARLGSVLVAAAILAAAQASPAPAANSVLTLTIDVENITTYIGDSDFADLASDPRATVAFPKTFSTLVGIGDIVRLNGKPARGTWTVFTALEILAPIEAPGVAIADIARGGIATSVHEIQDASGRPIGSLIGVGMAGGPAPPLSPPNHRFGNLAVVGGTGYFFGAQGIGGETTNPVESFRFASASEDPSRRRDHGGGQLRFVFTLTAPAFDGINPVGSPRPKGGQAESRDAVLKTSPLARYLALEDGDEERE